MSSDRKKGDRSQSAEQKRRESEEQLSLLQTITTQLAAAEDLSSALEVVLRDVCVKTGWVLGNAWVPNPDGTVLDFVSAWYCGDGELEPFRTASVASHFERGVGLPGRVWESKQPAWVENVTNDPNFPRSAAARTAGLKTGVGVPILSGKQVIAVLEFFMRESRAQNERLLNVIASVASQLDLLHRATRAEAAARERQFRTLANSISQLAWMADGEGYIFWYNDRWYDYTGTTLEEMKGWGWQKVHHPDEVGRVVERIKVAFATGEPWEDTFPLRSKTGEYRWFLSRALPIFDAEGKVARWFGTNTDITEQRQIEQALRDTRDQLEQKVSRRTAELSRTNEIMRSILSNMGDAVVVADKNKNFLVFNPAAERMFGKGAMQMPPTEWSHRYGLYLPWKNRQKDYAVRFFFWVAMAKHVRHGAAPNLPEAYVKAVDGALIGPRNGSCGTAMFTRKPVIVTDVMTDPLWTDYRDLAKICGLRACWSSPILSPQGEVLGSFAMYRQETRGPEPEETRLTQIATHIAGIAIDRQRQQEILRERDARISLAAESADLAFWVLYPEGDAWMSDKGRRIYGFDSNLPLTCDLILSRIHPDERAAVKADYDRSCSLHGAFESEHRLLLPYGKTRWVIMRGRCLRDEHGNLLETIGVTLDVSAQKQAALQVQVQREEMAHRNRVALMGEMTASFAHELNQPLTAIANNASAARRFLEKGNIDVGLLRELLQSMVADSQRAGEVMRGIRSLVRKEPSVHTLLNLNAIITETVRLVSSDVLNRESVVSTELDPHLPQVQGTLIQIQQVLLNLIINALDAMEGLPPPERRVIISTRSDRGDVAEVSVRDFGVGLPKDRPDKVFDHFFSTKQKGMGMGLAIVRSIVEAHGGTITAENAIDRGARMVVRLPTAPGEVQKSKAAA